MRTSSFHIVPVCGISGHDECCVCQMSLTTSSLPGRIGIPGSHTQAQAGALVGWAPSLLSALCPFCCHVRAGHVHTCQPLLVAAEAFQQQCLYLRLFIYQSCLFHSSSGEL